MIGYEIVININIWSKIDENKIIKYNIYYKIDYKYLGLEHIIYLHFNIITLTETCLLVASISYRFLEYTIYVYIIYRVSHRDLKTHQLNFLILYTIFYNYTYTFFKLYDIK